MARLLQWPEPAVKTGPSEFRGCFMAEADIHGKKAGSPIRIGTRGSPLALAQAELLRRRLVDSHPQLREVGALEIVVIKTTGDRIQDRALSEMGGKGLFIKEIEEALIAGDIDLAVHSMKDLPTSLPAGLAVACLLEREDARDALIAGKTTRIADLKQGAIVGTASLRRQAQLLARRPDLRIVTLRGNVDTRLGKAARGEVDAAVLALAGLKRLGREASASAVLSLEEMLPAVAQGAIGIETRREDARLKALLAPINHAATETRVIAERACLAELEGSCRTPIAAYATFEGDNLRLEALVAMPDGTQLHRCHESAPRAQAAALGTEVGRRLKAMAGPNFRI